MLDVELIDDAQTYVVYIDRCSDVRSCTSMMSAILSASISPFTSMRRAWNSLVRNFDSSFFGVQGATAATRSAVVRIGCAVRARTMQAATFQGVSISPQSPRMRSGVGVEHVHQVGRRASSALIHPHVERC